MHVEDRIEVPAQNRRDRRVNSVRDTIEKQVPSRVTIRGI